MTAKRPRSRRYVGHPTNEDRPSEFKDLHLPSRKPVLDPVGDSVNILTPRSRRRRCNRK